VIEPAFRKGWREFVAERALHSTLREWRRLMTARNTLVGLVGAGVVVGLSGPFGTFSVMAPGPRVIYWTAIAFATFGIGTLSSRLIAEHTPLIRLGLPIAHALASPLCAVSVFATVSLISWLGGLDIYDTRREVFVLYLYCWAIALCVAILFAAYEISAKAEARTEPAAPVLLKRLPIELRGHLSHLSMQDHYVDVVTDKGRKLILMRLADAIAETDPVPGLRIHRSHWVALGAVARTRREGSRYMVEMKDGTALPISRSSLPMAREAGLVPANGARV